MSVPVSKKVALAAIFQWFLQTSFRLSGQLSLLRRVRSAGLRRQESRSWRRIGQGGLGAGSGVEYQNDRLSKTMGACFLNLEHAQAEFPDFAE